MPCRGQPPRALSISLLDLGCVCVASSAKRLPAGHRSSASARVTDCTVPSTNYIYCTHRSNRAAVVGARTRVPWRSARNATCMAHASHSSGACMTRRTCGHQVPLPWVDPAVPSGLPCPSGPTTARRRRGATGTGTGSVRPSSRRSCRLHSPPTRPNPNAPARHCTLVLSACMPHGTKSRERNRRNETSARFHKSWRRRLVPRRTYRQTLFALPIRLHDGV